jgi:hypothetical protein
MCCRAGWFDARRECNDLFEPVQFIAKSAPREFTDLFQYLAERAEFWLTSLPSLNALLVATDEAEATRSVKSRIITSDR